MRADAEIEITGLIPVLIAIGYPDTSEAAEDDELARRDRQPRTRLSLAEQVFGDAWGKPADLVR